MAVIVSRSAPLTLDSEQKDDLGKIYKGKPPNIGAEDFSNSLESPDLLLSTL